MTHAVAFECFARQKGKTEGLRRAASDLTFDKVDPDRGCLKNFPSAWGIVSFAGLTRDR